MSGRRAGLWLGLCLTWVACKSEPQRVDLVSDPVLPDGGVIDSGRLDAGRLDAGMPDPGIPDTGPGLPEAQIGDAASFIPVARCGNSACACDDGRDNDGDGLADGFDPECTGALDEDEATFATGKASKVKACRDCFWDEDQGTGNDSCRYPSECLRGAAVSGAGNCSRCQVASNCVDSCAARTPSGCDCFGCCDVWLPNGVKVPIELSERCSLENIDDPVACPRCTQSSQCRNECGRCELCPGRALRDLPADCRTSGQTNRCEEGQPVCATSGDCTTEQYCQLGCCFALLL